MALADIIKTALDQMQYIAKTETVIGEPIVAGDVTLIPVSRVSIGFAAGGAGKDEKLGNGAGTGGGIHVTPVAFIVVTGEKVQVQPLEPADPILSKVLSVAPDIITNVSKYFTTRNKKERKAKKDDGKKEQPARE
ncbi:MAG: hypothetical protein JW863_20665 [Chitinispirillaceae bacterium]|nr:hypothetical protein [Chitinispirillaceae bacterium]